MADEIVQQIGLTRSRPKAGGHVHFSIAALMDNRQGISDQLKAGHYASAALVPATPWLGAQAPSAPRLVLHPTASPGGADDLVIEPENGASTRQFAIWTRYGSEWRFTVQPSHKRHLTLQADPQLGSPDAVVVSSVNRLGIESVRAALQLRP